MWANIKQHSNRFSRMVKEGTNLCRLKDCQAGRSDGTAGDYRALAKFGRSIGV